MASPHEVHTPPPATIDPQHFQQFQTNDGPPAFSAMVPPSHPDSSLPPHSASHVHTSMPSLFQSEVDPGNSMSVPMQMSISSLPPPPANLNAMDVVSAIPPASTSSPGLLPDFPPQNGSFGLDPRLTGLDGLNGSHQLVSSPSATTASTNASHASSPGMNGMSTYSIPSSSLASALDGMAAARSRSDSSASPANLTSSTSDLGFSSGGSGPPTSVHESGFQFSMPGFENPVHSHLLEDTSPDVPEGAHLLVVGDMLKKIALAANSGSEACSMGRATGARDIVDHLKRNVLLVAELVAAMQLGDDSTQRSAESSPHSHSLATASGSGSMASITPPLDVGQQPHINGLHSYPVTSGSLHPNATPDMSDNSRKRCASSVAGDRAMKTMKLEPNDDAPSLQLQPPPPLHVPPPLMTSPVYSFNPAISSLHTSTMGDPTSASVPISNSRPASSAGIAARRSLTLLPQDVVHVQPPMHPAMYTPLDPVQAVLHPGTDFTSPTSATSSTTLPATGFNSAIWPDSHVPLSRHHSHSFSGAPIMAGIAESGINIAGPSSMQYSACGTYGSPTRAVHPGASGSSPPSAIPHAVRPSRSSSFSNLHGTPFAYVQADFSVSHNIFETMQSRPSTSGLRSPRASSPEYDDDMDGNHDSDDEGDYPQSYYNTPPSAGNGDVSENTGTEGATAGALQTQARQRRMSRTSPSADGGSGSGHGNEVPQEYRAEVERIFFAFLNSICSNLDATDAKGEPIHQTLMAKKMQRLDESPDFRPFKFRIQAFTNAFLEELSGQGYPEEKIPMKKIRNFLWNQPFISRFNEEGKKSKSKGNHIWHVDAKKMDAGWTFRPFRRKLAGTPPGVAYVGLRWTWTPRIWDPQASRSNMPVNYSSPSLPSWLAWNDDVLSGIPTSDSQSGDVTVEARFIQDGKEELLTHTVHITIAPMASVDSTFTPSRRPSLVGDIHNPRRVLSDSVVAQTTPPRLLRTQSSLAPSGPVVAPDSQVMQVLTTAAQRVAQEAQSQVVASPNDAGPELQALAKQQHVLTVTAQAFNSKMTGEIPEGSQAQSNALTAAAQQVVLQAARQVAADRSVAAVSSGFVPSPSAASQVTVKDVSVATQSAVAQAVDMVGPLSSEVDVLMTASSLLQQQTRGSHTASPLLESQMVTTVDPTRPHSTGTSPPVQFSIPPKVPTPTSAAFFPP
ncbi:hypothetical protein B0H21DRAFT_818313 [Amylocystis lapponica]|nr:hypothetical protein B0H21DRAFT_818313 [Amylocystis lapponica]